MPNCIYNTDPKWIEVLSATNNNIINFWRKDKRKLNLVKGDRFYFKVRGTYFIAGKASFKEMKPLTIDAAWDEFKTGNGVLSKDAFYDQATKVLGLSSNEINSIVLENPIWLKKENYIPITESLFSKNILASKFVSDDEARAIEDQFLSNVNEHQSSEIDSIFEENEEYEEGKILLSIHSKRERNQELIKRVKNERKWICEICSLNFKAQYKIDYIEAHHKKPLSSYQEETVKSKLEDIALLCANCHRAVHRHMIKRKNLSYEEIKNIILSTKP